MSHTLAAMTGHAMLQQHPISHARILLGFELRKSSKQGTTSRVLSHQVGMLPFPIQGTASALITKAVTKKVIMSIIGNLEPLDAIHAVLHHLSQLNDRPMLIRTGIPGARKRQWQTGCPAAG